MRVSGRIWCPGFGWSVSGKREAVSGKRQAKHHVILSEAKDLLALGEILRRFAPQDDTKASRLPLAARRLPR